METHFFFHLGCPQEVFKMPVFLPPPPKKKTTKKQELYFSSPALMKVAEGLQAAASVPLVSFHLHSELPTGSASGGYNLSSPECYPLLTHRFPVQ